jgi:hypothetical protein
MPPIISINLLKDSNGEYAIDVHPTTILVSPSDPGEDQFVTLTFDVIPEVPPPHQAKAVVAFSKTPFDEENGANHTVFAGAPAVFASLRPDSVGEPETSVALYKYTITVTTPEGIELPPLDPQVMVRRRRVSKKYYDL